MVATLNDTEKYRIPQIEPNVPKTDINGSTMRNVLQPPVMVEFI